MHDGLDEPKFRADRDSLARIDLVEFASAEIAVQRGAMDAVGMSPAQNDPAPIREKPPHLIQYIEPFCSVMSAAGTLCMSCHRYAKRIGESLSSISNLLV